MSPCEPVRGDGVAVIEVLHLAVGLVDGRRVALRVKETALLQCAYLAVLSLGHIEDNGVRVQLRRGVQHGFGERHPGAPAACETGHNGSRVHAGAARERAGNGRVGVPDVDERRGRKSAF